MYLGKVAPTKSPYKIIMLFIVMTFLVAIFVFYTSFSKAKIVIKPNFEKISTSFFVTVGKGSNDSTSINGRFVQREIEGSDELNDILTKKIDDFARGKVVVHNKLKKNLTLVANSQLKPKDSNIIFKTDKALILPAGAKVQVGITASKKGVDGNIAPMKFNFVKLWSGWSNLVYAQSKETMSGGEKEGQIVSEKEINNLKEKLTNDLFEKGIEKLKGELKDNEDIWEKIVKKEEVFFKPSVLAGQEAEQLKADLKLKLITVLFNKEMLKNLAEAKLKGKVIDGKDFIGLDEESFNAEILEMDSKKKKAKFKIFLDGKVQPVFSDDVLDKEKIIGLNEEELKKYYKKYRREIDDVEIYFSPFWQKSVPSAKDHVDIVISTRL